MIILPAKISVSRKIMTDKTPSYWIKSIWLLAMVGLLILGGCAKKKRPADILSRDQMVKALAEIYINEQKINKLSLDTDSSQIVFKKMKDRIFADLGIQDSIMKKSYAYYTDRPLELEQIYTALVDTLNLYEQRGNLNRGTRQNPK
jgi:hypothetical protein